MLDNQALIEELKKRGHERIQSVIDPFLSIDPLKVHFVLEGSMNLSTSKVEKGEAVGRLDNFTQILEGELIFGAALDFGNNLAFLIDAEVESVIIDLSIKDIKELANTEEFGPVLIPLIESWVNRLYEGVADDTSIDMPLIHDFLSFTTSFCSPENSIVGNHELSWVRFHEIGKCKFNNHLDVNTDGVIFPVGKRSYLAFEDGVKLTTSKTIDVVSENEFWNGLQELLLVVLRSDAYEIKHRESQETKRLIEKYRLEKEEFSESLKSFSKVFQKEDTLEVDFESHDNLFNAVSMVLKFDKIKIEFPKGYSKNEDFLSEICRYNGIRYREILLESDWFERNTEDAFLAYINDDNGDPLAVIPHKGSMSFANSKTEEVIHITSDNCDLFKQQAFVFYKPFPSDRPVTIKDIVVFTLEKNKVDLIRVFAMGFISSLFMLLFPILTAQIFDFVIPSADKQQLLSIAFALVAISFGTVGFELVKEIALMRAENRLDYKTQSALWDRLLNLPTDFFSKYSTGDMASRSMGINEMKSIISGTAITSVLALAFSVLNLGLLFYYSASLAGLAIVFSLVQITVISLFARLQLKLQAIYMEQGGKLEGIAFQILNGVPQFRASGSESRAFLFWFKAFMKAKTTAISLSKLQNAQTIVNSVLGILSSVFLFVIVKTTTNDLTTGQFFAFLAAYGGFVGAIIGLSASLVKLLELPVIYNRLRPILETLPESETLKSAPTKFTGSIEMNNINFRYKADAPLIIKELDISIKSGEYIALVGPSGSGKSTLIRLLLGFSKPETGSIYFDKQDMEHYDPKMLRRNMGVVLQDGDLMEGDIFSNIVGSSSQLTLNDAWEAARSAAFDHDILSMPMGMHTLVNEDGGTLSGGQKQRLMIARALVHNPKILIFDEATSALDNETQAIVTASLDNLNVTRIVVAHRLSTIINADKIYYLEGGALIESGSFDELMALKGQFHKLAERQIE